MVASIKTFDKYVSLGNNCETAFQFRRVLARDSSSFFSWNVTMFDALLSILSSKFAGVVKLDNLTNHPDKGLMHDASHDFYIHSPFNTTYFMNEAGFRAQFDELVVKFEYLIAKFERDAASEECIAYFYKTEGAADARLKARMLRDVIAGYHRTKDFVLILLQPQSFAEAPWNDDRIYNRYLRRLAPWHDAPDGHVSSWDSVFREFPHSDGLHLAGY